MKKIIGIIFLIIVMLSTISFAAYPEELENQELLELEAISEISEQGEAIEGTEESVLYSNEDEHNHSHEDAEIIDDDVYKLEEEVTITETINGNVYVMAKTLKIDGAIIYGNLFAIAENIEIVNSEIEGSLYVLGENVTFSGLAYDAYICGSTVNFDNDSYIWRDIKGFASNMTMNGNAYRNCYLYSNNLTVGEKATIEGKLTYNAENSNISQEAKISEVQVIENDDMEEEYIQDNKNEYVSYIIEALQVAIKTLIVSLIIVFLVKKFEKLDRTNSVAKDFAVNSGKGLALLVFIPIISVVFTVSIIGTAFGFIIMALYIIALYITLSVTSLEIAQRILSKKEDKNNNKNLILVSILVSLIIWAIKFVPILGGIVRFVLILIGLGIIWNIIYSKKKKEKVNEI